MISLGTCPSSLAAVSNGLVDVFTTFRVSDNGSKGVWSLVGTKTFRTLDLDLHMLLGWVIESITLRSVTSVSLSCPEPGNRWERTPQKKRKREKHVTGPGSSLWRRDHRLWKVEWPAGTDRPRAADNPVNRP